MGAMILDSNIFWGLIMTLGFVILGVLIFYFKLKNLVPEAFVLMQAREKKVPVIMFHYPNNVTKLLFPQLEEKVEDIANYFRADGVYKFWDASGQNYERLNGDVTLYHVLSNVPETVSHKIAAMMSQVEAFLKNSGYPIDGMQDLFFYVLSELDKEGEFLVGSEEKESPFTHKVDKYDIIEKRLRTIDELLNEMGLDDRETKKRLKDAIAYLHEHLVEFEQITPHYKNVPFSFQTMIRAWDNVMAFTSKNFLQAKTIIETKIKRRLGIETKQILAYAFGTLVVLFGVAIIAMGCGWV
jgi:hypothetical protein